MRTQHLVLGATAALSVGALALGVVGLQTTSAVDATSAVTPTSPQTAAVSAQAHHHVHRRRLLGFSGSFEVDRSSGVVTWSWARGTLQSLTTSSVTILEPNGATFTAPLGANVRFRGLSEAAAESAHGVRVLVVERNGSVVFVRFPHQRSRSTVA